MAGPNGGIDFYLDAGSKGIQGNMVSQGELSMDPKREELSKLAVLLGERRSVEWYKSLTPQDVKYHLWRMKNLLGARRARQYGRD
jgi:hypothetical protein